MTLPLETLDALRHEAEERCDPLLALWVEAQYPFERGELRTEAIEKFAFSVTTREALCWIAERIEPTGGIDVGAGLAWWARRLRDECDADVIAVDTAPPPHPRNPWYKTQTSHFHVKRGGSESAAEHADRVLILMWPMCSNEMGYDIVNAYTRAGGHRIIYAGEREGGWTGTTNLFALLATEWREVGTCAVPQWQGLHDELICFERAQ